jgi:hypothetical protein
MEQKIEKEVDVQSKKYQENGEICKEMMGLGIFVGKIDDAMGLHQLYNPLHFLQLL